MEDTSYGNVSRGIDDWLELHRDEWFRREDIWAHFGLNKLQEGTQWKKYVAVKLNNEVKAGILEKNNTKFRIIDTTLDEINWMEAKDKKPIEIRYPLGLESFVKTYPQSIITVAAPPGWGKSAYLFNVALCNMDFPHGVYIWSHDLSDVEIWERIEQSGFEIPNPPPFKIYERMGNFKDVVGLYPDALHIIDYLSLDADRLYMVDRELKGISEKLKGGVAFVGLQKHPNAKLPYGGTFAEMKPKLTLVIETKVEYGNKFNILRIHKCRGRQDPDFDPVGMEFKFKIRRGIRLERLDEPEDEAEIQEKAEIE